MSEKLRDLRSDIHTRRSFFQPMSSPMNWVGDGIDHINIYSFGETDLGQALSHDSPVSFRHNRFGFFSSMEVFWHYIQSEERDDRIRSMSRPSFKKFKSKLTYTMVTNFRAIIMDSNYQRIAQNPKIVEAIKESVLPFDCYHNSNEHIRQRPKYFAWLLYGFEEIRKALKENREPDFKPLLDNPDSEIYQFVCADSVVPKKNATSETTRPQRKNRKNNSLLDKKSTDHEHEKDDIKGEVKVDSTLTETTEEVPADVINDSDSSAGGLIDNRVDVVESAGDLT